LAQMDALKPAFDYATSRDTGLAEKYSATTKYLGVTSAIAARGVTVRRARAKGTKGATTASPTPSPAPAAATPAPEAPAAEAPVAK